MPAVSLLLLRIVSPLKIEACLDVLNIDFVVPFRETHSGKASETPVAESVFSRYPPLTPQDLG